MFFLCDMIHWIFTVLNGRIWLACVGRFRRIYIGCFLCFHFCLGGKRCFEVLLNVFARNLDIYIYGHIYVYSSQFDDRAYLCIKWVGLSTN